MRQDAQDAQVAIMPATFAMVQAFAATKPIPPDWSCDRAVLGEHFAFLAEWLWAHRRLRFTFDAAARDDGSNAMCARYASPMRSFLETDVAGECVWANPPFTHVRPWVLHYKACKRRNPEGTSAMFLVPQWEQLRGFMKAQGFQQVKVYPAGTYLFSKALPDGTRQALPGIPWAVSVWFDPPAPKALLRVTADVVDTQRAFTFSVEVAGHRCSALVDTGAFCEGKAHGFITPASLATLQAGIVPASTRGVRVADGTEVPVLGAVRVKLRMQDFHDRVTLLVIDKLPGVDVILSLDWLRRNNASAHFTSLSKDHLILRRKTFRRCKPMGCHPRPPLALSPESLHEPDTQGQIMATVVKAERTESMAFDEDAALETEAGTVMAYVFARLLEPITLRTLISAKQAVRAMKKGASSYLMLVRPVEPVSPAQSASCEDLLSDDEVQVILNEYKDVFEEVKDLPPDRGEGHSIPLVPGAVPPAKRSYRLSQKELQEVRTQVTELLAKGFIEPSTSPYGAPVIFVQKADGSLRMVLDYRALNKITVKRRFPMPNIVDLFDQLEGAKVFSSLDLQQGYNQVLISNEDRPKTAFIAPGLGQYQFKVLCFGLTNAPATFQAMMHKIFGECMGKFVLCYLDDICIYSKDAASHAEHLRTVLGILRRHGFKAKLSKCQFNRHEIRFLGHTVTRHGLALDDRKVTAVRDWPVPTNLRALRSFLGLANYFRRFIQGYSSLVAPLTTLTRTDVPWCWTPACQAAFEGVKRALTEAPVLKLPEMNKPFEVISDASVHGTGAVLMQEGRPCAYTSAKFSKAEYNYTTTDQECLGTVRAMEEFRCYLEGAPEVTLVTDHQPLVWLQGQQQAEMLSRRQARYMEKLSRFAFKWEYRPGRINVADPLSRKHEHEYGPSPTVCAISPIASDLQQRIGVASDKLEKAEAKRLQLRKKGQIYVTGKGQIYVPADEALRTSIVHEFHDTYFCSHQGVSRTKAHLSAHYWWPGMDRDVKAYVAQCPFCQRNKATTTKPAGLLQPLPVPTDVWDSVSMDFITQLPPTASGHDSLLVFVDRLSKMTHLVAMNGTDSAEDVARHFVTNVFRLHGLPESIVSDRDSRFTSAFWRECFRLLGTKLRMSTAFHPQTDGQTERMNRVVEEAVRHYIAPDQSDWDQHLPLIEFAINNSKQASTGCTPFSLNGMKQPRVPATTGKPLPAGKSPNAERVAAEMRKRIERAKACIRDAQARQKQQADKKRSDFNKDAPEWQVGQYVLLSTRNLTPKPGQAKKLLPRWAGPYRILQWINPVAAKLELPMGSRLHPVFHVSLLKPFKGKKGTTEPPPPPPLDVEGELFYHVESVIGHRDVRVRGGKSRSKRSKASSLATRREYLVKWVGYGHEHNTFEPEDSLRDSIPVGQLIDAYERTLPAAQRRVL